MPSEPFTLTVFCGSRHGARPIYTEAAAELGRLAAAHNIRIAYGGGRLGLMGVLADAALAAGGEVVGIIPEYLTQHEVLHPGLTETFIVADLFARKQRMLDIGHAFASLPGGFGTLDEFFEVVSWIQLGQLDAPNVLVNIEGYFDRLLGLVTDVVAEDFARAEHLERIQHVDSVPELIALLEGGALATPGVEGTRP